MVRKIYTIDNHNLNTDNNEKVIHTINLIGRLTNWTSQDIKKIADEEIQTEVPKIMKESEEIKDTIKELIEEGFDEELDQGLLDREISGYEFSASDEVLNVDQTWPDENK